MKSLITLSTALLSFSSLASYGAAVASDNASNVLYNGGRIDTGENGGSGFGTWTVTPGSNSGFAGNFEGSSDAGSDSWGFYANTSNTSSAVRTFTTGGPSNVNFLAFQESFSLTMDNNSINNGGTVGFGLQNSSATNRLEFYFLGGDSAYTVNIGGTAYLLNGAGGRPNLPFTSTGLSITYFQQASNAFTLSITRLSDNALFTVTNATTQSLAASDISQVRLFNFNAGGSNDQFFNNLVVVPEPTSAMLLGASALASMFMMRRRRN